MVLNRLSLSANIQLAIAIVYFQVGLTAQFLTRLLKCDLPKLSAMNSGISALRNLLLAYTPHLTQSKQREVPCCYYLSSMS